MSGYCNVCGSDDPNGIACKDPKCPRVFESLSIPYRDLARADCALREVGTLEYRVEKYRGEIATMRVWCADNLTSYYWCMVDSSFKFTDECDAIAFVTRFAGGERDIVIPLR